MSLENNKILIEQWKKTLSNESLKQSTRIKVQKAIDNMIAAHPEVVEKEAEEAPKEETKSKRRK